MVDLSALIVILVQSSHRYNLKVINHKFYENYKHFDLFDTGTFTKH